MSSPTICLIGPGALSSNPRVVKEADALASAGYRVRVVCGTAHSLGHDLDSGLTATRMWDVTPVPLGPKWRRIPAALGRMTAAKLAWGGWWRTSRTAARAEVETVGRLAAVAPQADLYIGHYLGGLAAAAAAAHRHQAALGFDAEDSHVDELPDDSAYAGRRAARELIERTYLPRCRHVTAAAPLIADALARRYEVRAETVLNVFPRAEAPDEARPTLFQRGGGPPSLYWFSQTIGRGRGLEQLLESLRRMHAPAHLHLRGTVAAGYENWLRRATDAGGLAGRVHLYPQAPPAEMARLAAGHDLGLSLELAVPPNRAICLTNKTFTYLLAGVPAVLSRTPAQTRLASDLGPAGLLIDLDDPAGTAAALDGYLADPVRAAAARAHAWNLGQTRFNWDIEQEKVVTSVRRALGAGL